MLPNNPTVGDEYQGRIALLAQTATTPAWWIPKELVQTPASASTTAKNGTGIGVGGDVELGINPLDRNTVIDAATFALQKTWNGGTKVIDETPGTEEITYSPGGPLVSLFRRNLNNLEVRHDFGGPNSSRLSLVPFNFVAEHTNGTDVQQIAMTPGGAILQTQGGGLESTVRTLPNGVQIEHTGNGQVRLFNSTGEVSVGNGISQLASGNGDSALVLTDGVSLDLKDDAINFRLFATPTTLLFGGNNTLFNIIAGADATTINSHGYSWAHNDAGFTGPLGPGTFFTDGSAKQAGIEYPAPFPANLQPGSLVYRDWVEQQIAAASGQKLTLITANNAAVINDFPYQSKAVVDTVNPSGIPIMRDNFLSDYNAANNIDPFLIEPGGVITKIKIAWASAAVDGNAGTILPTGLPIAIDFAFNNNIADNPNSLVVSQSINIPAANINEFANLGNPTTGTVELDVNIPFPTLLGSQTDPVLMGYTPLVSGGGVRNLKVTIEITY